MNSIGTIYNDYIWRGESKDLAERLYNAPPETLGSVFDRIVEIMGAYEKTDWFSDDRTKTLEGALIDWNREIGCLTSEVQENIHRLREGAIEVAHQSVVLGGPCYILNKAATASIVSSIGNERGVAQVPYYCIADYDIVQAELINIRTPLMGHEGNLISVPVPKGYENSPVSAVPLPAKSWLEEVEESIRANYHPLFKAIVGGIRRVFEERLDNALTVIRWAFTNSKTIGDFAQRIIGWIVNIQGGLGIPIISASDKRVRSLLAMGLEFLLRTENRERFLQVQAKVTRLIMERGFKPSFHARPDDYVPFFYECQNAGCNKSRTELKYERKNDMAILRGKCPSCGEKIEIEVSVNEPDLADIAMHISPRVDSRQFAVDTMIPVTVHIGGPGEGAYYAQVIPVAKELEVPFPDFIRYPRVYFNTPWNETLAKSLIARRYPVLHSPEMFKIIGKSNRFRKKKRYDEMNEMLMEFENLLVGTLREIRKAIEALKTEISEAPKEKKQELRKDLLDLERYLSWAFGQYAPEKLGQETAWLWIEWAVNSGMSDLFGPYKRAYMAAMKNGATLFVNFST